MLLFFPEAESEHRLKVAYRALRQYPEDVQSVLRNSEMAFDPATAQESGNLYTIG
jgi:hypothetical protein